MWMPWSGSTGIRVSPLVVDELVALGLLAELREDALRGLVEPDPAVVVLADGQVGDLGGVGADVPARRRSRSGSAGGTGSAGSMTPVSSLEHVADESW